MSLAEIRGTPLGTKMGVKPVTVIAPTVTKTTSTLKATTAPRVIVPKTATTVNTIFSQNIGVKTTVPYEMASAPIPAIPQNGGSIIDLSWAALNIVAQQAGFNVLQPKAMPKTEPKYLAVTPTYTPAQTAAIKQAQNLQLGSQLVSSKANQKVITTLRSAAIVRDLTRQGLEIIPSSTLSELKTDQEKAASFRDQLNALMGLQGEWASAQAGYLSRISTYETELSKATSEGAIAKGQLTLLGTQYEDLMKRYQDLLGQGGGGQIPPTPSIWGDLLKYVPYIIVGIVLLLLLPNILKKEEK